MPNLILQADKPYRHAAFVFLKQFNERRKYFEAKCYEDSPNHFGGGVHNPVALHTEGVWTVDNRLTVHGYDYPWEEWHTKGPYAYDPLYNPYDNYNYDSPWW